MNLEELDPDLRTLELRLEWDEDVARQVCKKLAASERALTRLVLSDPGVEFVDDLPDQPLVPNALARKLFAALPALEELVIDVPGLFAGISSPSLRVLELTGLPLTRLLAGLDVPNLTRLRWACPGDVYGVAMQPKVLAPLWKAGAFPRLKDLDLLDLELDGSPWVKAMVTSEVVGHLTALRAPGIDDPAGILKHADRLENLETLVVRWVDGRKSEELRARLPKLVVEPPPVREPPTRMRLYSIGDDVFYLHPEGFRASAFDDVSGKHLVLVGAKASEWRWGEDEAQAFAEIASRFEGLTVQGGVEHEPLARALGRHARWSHLDLRDLYHIDVVLDALQQVRSLAVDLSTESDLLALVRALSRSTPEHLTVASSDVPEAGGAVLEALMGRELVSLTVEGLPLAGPLPRVRELAWRGAEELPVDAIVQLLADRPELEALDLRDTLLLAPQVTALAEAVGNHAGLRAFRLNKVELDAGALEALATAVARAPRLVELELVQGYGYQSSLGRKLDYVPIGPVLEALGGRGERCRIRVDVAGAEPTLFELLRADRLIGLSCGLQEASFDALLDVLPDARSMQALHVGKSKVSDAGLKRLAPLLASGTLKSLGWSPYFGPLWKTPTKRKFLAALAGSKLERVEMRYPGHPDVLALAVGHPTLREVRVTRR